MEPLPRPGQCCRHSSIKERRRGVTLLDMGRKAKEIVPQCVGLSPAMLQDGRLTLTLAASHEEIAALDAVQYLDGGPWADGAQEATVVNVGEGGILDEVTAAAGVASSLTLPIMEHGRVVGTVNLYAATSDLRGAPRGSRAGSRVHRPSTPSPTATCPSAPGWQPPSHPPESRTMATSTSPWGSLPPGRTWTSPPRSSFCRRQPQ